MFYKEIEIVVTLLEHVSIILVGGGHGDGSVGGCGGDSCGVDCSCGDDVGVGLVVLVVLMVAVMVMVVVIVVMV